MEPLARPAAIEIPTRDNGLTASVWRGQSLLLEAPWVETDPQESDTGRNDEKLGPATVLGRVDVVDVDDGRSLFVQAYIHPSLRVRIVPTHEAPAQAAIPDEYVKRIQAKLGTQGGKKLHEQYSIPLKPYVLKERPKGEVIPSEKELSLNGRYYMDICFASLGWLSFMHDCQFALVPHCVEGSVFSKRKALYPTNLANQLEQTECPANIPDDFESEDTLKRLRAAAREGRHQKELHDADGDDFREVYDHDEYDGHPDSSFW
jgi:hypothetical protein